MDSDPDNMILEQEFRGANQARNISLRGQVVESHRPHEEFHVVEIIKLLHSV